MKRKIHLLTISFALFFILAGFIEIKAQKFEWAKEFLNHALGINVRAIGTDSFGNVYTAGTFSADGYPHLFIDLDPGVDTYAVFSPVLYIPFTPVVYDPISYLPDTIYSEFEGGNSDIYIAKLDSAGNFIWGKAIGGRRSEDISDMKVDKLGNIYMTGTFRDTVDFDPGPGKAILTSGVKRDTSITILFGSLILDVNDQYYPDNFVLKLDSAGDFVWVKEFGNDMRYESSFAPMALDKAGNVYFACQNDTLVDLDPGSGNYYYAPQMAILKLNAAGDFVWVKEMGGDRINDITVAGEELEHIYAIGNFRDTVDFDPSASGTHQIVATSNTDFYTSKWDLDGNFIWAKAMHGYSGGDHTQLITSIAVDKLDNVYVTGNFRDTIDLDPGVDTFFLYEMSTVAIGSNAGDMFIAKLNASGDFVWAKQIGDMFAMVSSVSLGVDDYGNVYNTGHFKNTLDFDPGPDTTAFTSNGSNDIYICKFGTHGQFMWAGQMVSSGLGEGGFFSNRNEQINALEIDSDNNIYTIGELRYVPRDSMDFDPGDDTTMSNGERQSVFVHKINYVCSNTSSSLTETACDSMVFNDHVYSSSGIYTQTLTNVVGCDSIVTLHLTINPTKAASISESACYSYALNGQTYTTSGIYTQKLTSSIGCDSILTIDLTIKTADVSVNRSGTTLTANASGASYQWLDCDNNKTPITGATSQSFTSNIEGNYAVVVIQDGCKDTSDCISNIPTSINEIFVNTINVFPNPSNGRLTITTQNSVSDATVRLLNIIGESLMEFHHLRGERFDFDVTDYPNGIYIIELSEGEKTDRIKLIKQ